MGISLNKQKLMYRVLAPSIIAIYILMDLWRLRSHLCVRGWLSVKPFSGNHLVYIARSNGPSVFFIKRFHCVLCRWSALRSSRQSTRNRSSLPWTRPQVWLGNLWGRGEGGRHPEDPTHSLWRKAGGSLSPLHRSTAVSSLRARYTPFSYLGLWSLYHK